MRTWGRLSVPDLAEELDVEWIVLGSLMQAGTESRFTVELVEASTDENRWAHSYTRGSKHVLGMQSKVAAAVAEAVNSVLMSNAVTHALPAPPPPAHSSEYGSTSTCARRMCQ